MATADQPHNPLFHILSGAVVISFSGIWVTWSGVDPVVSAFYRVFFGTIFLVVACLVRREFQPISAKTGLLIVLCSLCFAADLVLWHISIRYIGPGLATIIANFQVFILTGASFLFFGERIRPIFLISIPLAFFGLFLVVGFDWSLLSSNYRTGVYLGLGAALFYAAFLLSLRKIHEIQAGISFFYGLMLVSLTSSIFLGLQVLFSPSSFVIPGYASLGSLLCLALLSQTIGWALISNSLPKVVPSLGGLVLLLQPALAFVWDVALLDRATSFSQWFGVLITLAAIYLGMASSQKKK
jgi:drug/metabolite transporter (DMT)-like permease